MEEKNEDINSATDGGEDNTDKNEFNIDEILAKDEKTEEDLKTIADHAKKLEAQNKQLYERAKKAEATAKTLKIETKPINQPNETVGLSREEAILIAKGTDERIIDKASKIAKAEGITLLEAMKDEAIEAFSEKLKADEKKRKAQLGASGGGSSTSSEDLTQKVGMTREEHRKAIGM